MDTAAFDTDATLRRLTEALRRGPGSPEWHEAVSGLRQSTAPDADEYRLLITARERLESGRAYREVRAGPAFTRELFGRIGQAGSGIAASRPSVALVVQLLCLLTLVGVIAVGVMLVAGRSQGASPLAAKLFVTPVRSWAFDRGVPKPLRAVGPLALEGRGPGLHASGRDADLPAEGLLVDDGAIDLAGGVCLELRLDHHPGPTAVQLVLLQDLGQAAAGGAKAGEAKTGDAKAVDALAGELKIVCDAAGVRAASPTETTSSRPLRGGPHLLRLKAAGGQAVAEVDGEMLWAGRVPWAGPGFAAVRFVRTARAGVEPTVQSLRVLAP